MASPFTIFRKHQKVAFAVLTIMAMIAFVFLPNVGGMLSGKSRENLVVVETKYENLTQRQIGSLMAQRQIVLNFLQRAAAVAAGRPIPLEFIERAIGPLTEEAVVDSWLLTKRAQQMGMQVSDAAINAFIKQFTQNRVTADQLSDILKSLRVSQAQLFEAYRNELMAWNLRRMFFATRDTVAIGMEQATPAQRWDYFQRLNRQATVELLPVLVADYVGKIENPDEATLSTFFDKHKEEYASLDSPEPGFREPLRIAIQYVKADYAKFIDPKSVTEEEIKLYYDEFKSRDFVKVELPGLEEPKDESPKPLATPAAKKPDEKQKAVKSPPGSQPPQNQTTEKESPSKQPATPDAQQPSPTQYRPLKEVEGEIRERLAVEHADARIKKMFAPLRAKMEEYHDALILAEAEEESGSGSQKLPPRPDFAALAASTALTMRQAGPLAQYDLAQLDIGKSMVESQLPFVAYAFETLPLFRPAISIDVSGNQYLVWKTDELKDRVPKFDDKGVRQEVLVAWKTVQARKLAVAEAEKLAAAVRNAKTSLKNEFAGKPDMHVITPDAFSWMTQGAVPALTSSTPPRLSEPEGVDRPGDAFMRTVFSLEQGQVSVAMNQPETVAYVIQVTSLKPSVSVLWDLFQADDYSKYAAAGMPDELQLLDAWQKQIQTDAGLRWLREPHRRVRHDSGD